MSFQPQPPLQPPVSTSNSPVPVTRVGLATKGFLLGIWEPINIFGFALMGIWWKIFCSMLRDVFSLAIILKFSSAIILLILGKNFDSYDVCPAENAFGVSRYACYLIVTADFALWILIGFRMLARFVVELLDFVRGK
jgi:hypothetical protein